MFVEMIQVRVEPFNLFNTVTPGIPQTTMTSTDFGRATSIAGAPRIVQLGVKYQFKLYGPNSTDCVRRQPEARAHDKN